MKNILPVYYKMSKGESTKPYIYFEQIMNGIVSIPEAVQAKLTNVMLVRRKELDEKREPESNQGIMSWFNGKRDNEVVSEPEPEKTESNNDIMSWFKGRQDNEVVPESEPEKTESDNGIMSWFKSDAEPESQPIPMLKRKCDIRGWQ